MTSDAPRFPLGLTVATVIALAIMCGLGVWQTQRFGWKQGELARIAARQSAPPTPIRPVLARAAAGDDATFTRVSADCVAAAPAPATLHMTTVGGDWIARAMTPCQLTGAAYGSVMVDRGLVASSRGNPNPPGLSLPAPGHIAGVLYAQAKTAAQGGAAPYLLVAESESPAVPGVAPTPYSVNAADNLQYVGSYAPTWFGLAGVAACFYAAMLWRRYHPK